MGDRGNIFVVHERDESGQARGVYLYTHWSGYRIKEIAADGLSSRAGSARLGDPAYLSRILFDTLTGLEGGETGYGIGISAPDNERPIVVVEPGLGWNGLGSVARVAVAHQGSETQPDLDWQSVDDFVASAQTAAED